MLENCKFCNKTFSNKYTLKTHQKTAKFCLDKQKEKNNFKCSDCGKILSTKHKLSCHLEICLKHQVTIKTCELENKIKEMKEYIDYQENFINNIYDIIQKENVNIEILKITMQILSLNNKKF